MSVDFSTQIPRSTAQYASSANSSAPSGEAKATEEAKASAAASGNSSVSFGEAAVYEKSSEPSDSVTIKSPQKEDRSAIVAQLKADAEQRQSQLLDLVRQTMQGQGLAIAKTDDMWRFLADGNFSVDPATKAQAQADVAEDGYWGAEQTSDRILDFAKALAGDDPANADKMLDAFKKGFEDATKTWGKDLPDLSKRTYDAVLKKFDDWKNSANSTGNTQQQAEQASQQAAAAGAVSE